MKIRSVFLAAFLLGLAVAAGWLLPRGMAWFQSATTPLTVEYPVQAVDLEYTRELQLAEKYDVIRRVESYGLVKAGHVASEQEIETIVMQFLQTAFPKIETDLLLEIQPAIIVSDGLLLTAWYCHVIQSSDLTEPCFMIELMVDDATGAVLSLSMDALEYGLLPVLCSLYGLPEDYWQQTPDTALLMQMIAEQFQAALESGQSGLVVTPVQDYAFAPPMPADLTEPLFFAQRLILEQQGAVIDLELCAQDHCLQFN